MMNEPHNGYVGEKSLHSFDYNVNLHLSYMREHPCCPPIPRRLIPPMLASAFQSFLLGAGHPTPVPHFTRSFPMPTRATSQVVLNPDGHKVWRPDGPTEGRCIWEMHGVWGWDRMKKEGVVLRENYFVRHPETKKEVCVVYFEGGWADGSGLD